MAHRHPMLLAAALLLAGCAAPGERRAEPRVPLERILELAPSLRLPATAFGGFTGAGSEFFATEETPDGPALFVVEAASGERRAFHDVERMQQALTRQAGLDAAKALELARSPSFTLSPDRRLAVFNEDGDLYAYRFDLESAVRLTNDPAEELDEAISPDGAWIAFVQESNLHVVSSSGSERRALTFGGDATHLFGRLDWVYQEEVFGRGNFRAHWWSPDSRRIALLALDVGPVPEYTIVDTRERRPDVEVWRYPKAGDPNPRARIAIAELGVDGLLYPDLSGYPEDVLIVRVAWSPDGREVWAQLQDRAQSWLEIVAFDARSGKPRRVLRESGRPWVTPLQGPFFLARSGEFVVSSESTGYEHLYLYRRDGTLVRALTSGECEVDDLLRVDEDARCAWYLGDQGDVRGNRLFRVPLDGGASEPVTPEPGTHQVALSPDGAYFVDTHAAIGSAPVQTLRDAQGAVVRELARVERSAFDALGFPVPEAHHPRTRDGFEMQALLYKPADFDPSRRYPLVCFVYGGPHAPQVRDTFHNLNSLFHSWLADQGVLVWVCDNRSASGKGIAPAFSVARRFGAGELADVEDGLDYAIGLGCVDPGRVGIWGWSFGGYLTAYAMTHSARFSAGIAGAPVTDWRLYDSIYTERYMGLPSENGAGYDDSSVVAAAGNLHGRLMLICGEIDENVHAQNTFQLAEALQKAGKTFELMVYPGNRHSVVEPAQRRHLYGMMAEYLLRNL